MRGRRTGPSWSVGLTLRGDYATAMRSVASFYAGRGFAAVGDPSAFAFVFAFADARYDVQAAGAARDHSAARTNVTIVVRLR